MNLSLLCKIARLAIEKTFSNMPFDIDAFVQENPELSDPGATFVTLTLHGNLRGCIGSIIAHRPLIEDIISNAKSAAFRDPRFSPLTINEWDKVVVEVSLLTHPVPVQYTDRYELSKMIRPGEDGVIIIFGNHQATFLPQVWDEIPDFDTFFAHLGMKAGIGSDPLSLHPDIYTYQVEKYKEIENG